MLSFLIVKQAIHVYDTCKWLTYCDLYRRNRDGCTLTWEIRIVQDASFERIVDQYTPLIKSQIHKLNLTTNYSLYEQAGLIALWECMMNYREEKGSFSAYAYLKVRGKLLDERRKEFRTYYQHSLNWSEYEEIFSSPLPVEPHAIDLTSLTNNQRKWVEHVVLEGRSLKSVAVAEGVSVEAVKSWRKSAIIKLRKQGAISLSN